MKVFKAPVFIVAAAALLLITFAALQPERRPVYARPVDFPITMCGSLSLSDQYWNSPVVLSEGLGDLHYAITTKAPMAQKYFDQGLRLVYGFNHVEALKSFREASRLDPSSAMTYWGQALTLGPNINDWNPKAREAMAQEAISKAKELGVGSSQKERDLILAMASRYDGKAYDDRGPLNVAYRTAMEKLTKKYPDDPEALVLYADAIMTSMPWDYWNADGSPKPLTSLARTALETAIKKHPRHPGAHHMYIHLVEASNKPSDAGKSAEFLETAMPAAGHIVHMPSHIYVRIGEYEKSNASNRLAVKADEEFLAGSSDQGLYRMGYYPHNIDFLTFGALMNGQSEMAMSEAQKLAYHVKALETIMPSYYDYYTPTPILAMVRYGKWEQILALPQSDDRYYQLAATHHYARGTAFLRLGKLPEAEVELHKLDSINSLDTLKTIYTFFNSTNQITTVATNLLKGEVLLAQKKTSEGMDALKAAVKAEDALRYNEPPDWRLPARHFLGAVLLEAGRYDEAEKVYTEDLVKNPGNGWALQGLAMCQQKLGKSKEAEVTLSQLSKTWKNADVKISSSRF